MHFIDGLCNTTDFFLNVRLLMFKFVTIIFQKLNPKFYFLFIKKRKY